MPAYFKRGLVVLLVLCLSLVTARPARADIAYTKDSKAIGVIVAVVAVGALRMTVGWEWVDYYVGLRGGLGGAGTLAGHYGWHSVYHFGTFGVG